MNKTPRLLIVRGLPGSGKSTYVKNNYPGLFTLETDMFNVVGGKYYWTIERSKCAIDLIRNFTINLVESNNDPDFCICGVFGRFISFYSYIKLAIENGYDVYIKTLNTMYKNIHNVPEETLKMFKENFISEDTLKEMVNNDPMFFKYKNKIHFTEMPKIDWKFEQEEQLDNNYTGEG